MVPAGGQLLATRICTVVLTVELVSVSPDTTNTEPLPSTVPVGYQRPPLICAASVNVSDAGSKTAVLGSPKKSSYLRVPPRTSGRPLDNITMPLQNMSHRIGKVLTIPLAGSQTPA